MLDVCDHQRQGDHHIGLNVTWFVFSDELQIILKCMRFAEVLCNDLMNIWNPSMFHPNVPKPIWKHVQTTHYVDANLHHDLATGKAVTAALHFLNQTPIDAYTKRQSTVETATYGSEFVAARTVVDQIIDIRTTL